MAEENQIIIDIEESDNQVQLNVDMNINISNYGKCALINAILESLHVKVDWSNPLETASFSFFMFRHLCKEGNEKISIDKRAFDILTGGNNTDEN